MADDLKVRMGVDINGVLQGMKRAEKSLEDFKNQAARFKAALDKATDPATILRLNKAIEATGAKIKLIQSAGLGAGSGLDKVKQGGDRATQALTDLGRVAQDAPFGFIGIANNLNPLLESFQRLRAETGSGKAALSALGSSLMGAGGLGFALSAVTAAISFASIGFEAWTRGLKNNNKEIDDQKKKLDFIGGAYDAYYNEIQRVTEALSKESTKVQLLTVALNDSNTSANQRKNIIGELNQISPKYLGHLDKEKASYEQIAKAVFEYTASLAKSVEIKALLPEFEKLVQKMIKAQVELNQLRRIGTDQQNFFGLPEAEFKAEEKRLSSVINATLNEINFAKKALADIAGSGLSLNEILFGKEINSADKPAAAKKVETIRDVIGELSREIDFLNAKQIAFGTNEAKAKISAIQSTIEKLIKDFKVDPQDALINKLFYGGTIKNDVKGFNIPGIRGLKTQLLETVRKDFEKGAPATIEFPVQVKMIIENSTAQSAIPDNWVKELKDAANSIGEQMAQSMAASFGDALGKAIAGGSYGNIFGSVFAQLGASISALGDLFIKTGVEVAIFKKLLLKSPGLAIAAGIALKTLGSFLQAKIQSVPGFADGVTNFRGGLAMVGERGPELVRLPKGSDVVPNHSLGNIGGGMNMNLSGNFRVAGTDLVLVLDRAQRSQSRVG